MKMHASAQKVFLAHHREVVMATRALEELEGAAAPLIVRLERLRRRLTEALQVRGELINMDLWSLRARAAVTQIFGVTAYVTWERLRDYIEHQATMYPSGYLPIRNCGAATVREIRGYLAEHFEEAALRRGKGKR